MANRHKRAKGGRVYYSGGASKVADEAAGKKHGGKVVGKIEGGKGKFARGGAADSSPFSSAGGGGASKNPFSSARRG
jgi:hypothetical protein